MRKLSLTEGNRLAQMHTMVNSGFKPESSWLQPHSFWNTNYITDQHRLLVHRPLHYPKPVTKARWQSWPWPLLHLISSSGLPITLPVPLPTVPSLYSECPRLGVLTISDGVPIPTCPPSTLPILSPLYPLPTNPKLSASLSLSCLFLSETCCLTPLHMTTVLPPFCLWIPSYLGDPIQMSPLLRSPPMQEEIPPLGPLKVACT